MSFFQTTRRRLLQIAAAGLPGMLGAQTSGRDSELRKLLEPPAHKAQVVLDTDTYNEIDDQYALAYSLLSPSRMEVEAVYAAPFLNGRSRSAGDGMEKSYE
jgi:purine nucleosidase